MASIFKTQKGHWRVQVRRKGRYLSNTFRLKTHAQEWANEVEYLIDLGREPKKLPKGRLKMIGMLIDLHLEDLRDVGRPIRRSKMAVLEALSGIWVLYDWIGWTGLNWSSSANFENLKALDLSL